MTSNRSGTTTNEPTRTSSGVQNDRKNGHPAKKLNDDNATTEPPVSAPVNASFCLVVSADGEYATLEIFTDLVELKARLRALQGQSVNAFPFFGIPMAYTPGPDRFLYLPDGQIEPLFEFANYGSFIPMPDAKPPIDARYFLGGDEDYGGDSDSAIIDHRRPVTGPQESKEHRSKDVAAEPSVPPAERQTDR